MKMLDLRGTPHADARRKVIEFIEDNWSSGEEGRIITGHSRIMMEIVLSIIRKYNILYDINGILSDDCFIVVIFK